MMLPTHVLVGMALALPFAAATPEFAGVALVAGAVGGAVPDFDMYAGHRRTLHYPVYYAALGVPAVGAAALVPTAGTTAAAVALLAAAVHSASDALGGGLELRPWEATSDRAVYDHWRGRWLAPRRVVRYDGAPEDLLLAVAVAVPLLLALGGVRRWTVFGILAVATAYAAVRRVLPDVAEWLLDGPLVRRLPDGLLARVPPRYRRGVRSPRSVEPRGDGR
ncbi:MAG: metal-dependent hydrolase [Haloferacaceae archaeon]